MDLCEESTTCEASNETKLSRTKSTTKFKIPPNWAQAPEFVPRSSNWLDAPEFIPSSTASNTGDEVSLAQNEEAGPDTTEEIKHLFPFKRIIIPKEDVCFPPMSSIGNNTERFRMSLSGNWFPSSCAKDLSPLTFPIKLQLRAVKLTPQLAEDELCRYQLVGECRYGNACRHVHGNICDLCGQYALHPRCAEQNEVHKKSCMEQHEKNMEFSFAMAESLQRQCDICYDVIMDKENLGDQRFGILPGCSHCYCLSCIRKWRLQSRQFETRVTRACPTCRVISPFVVPSRYWVTTPEEKEKLIENYKKAMSEKPCRYFSGGMGYCPFSDSCFYLHKIDPTVVAPVSQSSSSLEGGGADYDSDEDW